VTSVKTVDNWISTKLEQAILEHIYELDDLSQKEKDMEKKITPASENDHEWISLRQRRVKKYIRNRNQVENEISSNWPDWIQNLILTLFEPIFPESYPPNHVLVNEYSPPNGCILPHQDGPMYFPLVAILSLGGNATMEFIPHRKFQEKNLLNSFKLELEKRSFLVIKDEVYNDYLHGVNQVMTETRISLTIRHMY
jgi:alkylated DNA repair dioxygenase AlkB